MCQFMCIRCCNVFVFYRYSTVKPTNEAEYGGAIARLSAMINETSIYVNNILINNDNRLKQSIENDIKLNENTNQNNNNNNNNNSLNNVTFEKTTKMKFILSIQINKEMHKNYCQYYNYFRKWNFDRILYSSCLYLFIILCFVFIYIN